MSEVQNQPRLSVLTSSCCKNCEEACVALLEILGKN